MVLASPLLRRATEALYLLKNGSFTGSYIYRLWKASIQYRYYIYELYLIIYHQRATEALYLLKNDWFTGVYGALVPEIEVRQHYPKHDSFIFLTGLVPK